MPGMILYRGLFRLVAGMPAVEPGDADLVLLASLTGVALAVGTSIGGSVGRLLTRPTERAARVAASLSRRRGSTRVLA